MPSPTRPITPAPPIGATVRPANDGETITGQVIPWTRLRGVVLDTWPGPGIAGEETVQVRWQGGRVGYPSVVPAGWLTVV